MDLTHAGAMTHDHDFIQETPFYHRIVFNINVVKNHRLADQRADRGRPAEDLESGDAADATAARQERL